jgi:hypothetical protein
MLYERVGDVETLAADAKANLESTAKEEVTKAIDALKQKYRMEDNPFDDSS